MRSTLRTLSLFLNASLLCVPFATGAPAQIKENLDLPFDALGENEVLSTVASINFQRIKINTIGVLDLSALGEQFMRKLASMNGGTYTKI